MSAANDNASPVLSFKDVRVAAGEKKFVVLVYFRGAWCPWCQAYARDVNKLVPEIEAAGGRVFLVTSQSAAGTASVRADWGLDFDVVSDPSNEHAKGSGVTLDKPPFEIPGEYGEGMAQPALHILAGADLGRELFKWNQGAASGANFGGAKDRVHPEDAWKVARARLAGDDAAADAVEVRRINGAHVHKEQPDIFKRIWAYYSANVPANAAELRKEVEAGGGVIEE